MDYFRVTFKADWYHEKCSGNVLTLDETEQGEMSKGQSRETGNIRYTRQRKTKQKQSRETGNMGYTRRRKIKQRHNTICVGLYYKQTKTNNVDKACTILQTTGG